MFTEATKEDAMECIYIYLTFFSLTIVAPGMLFLATERCFGKKQLDGPAWEKCIILLLLPITDARNAKRSLQIALRRHGFWAALRYALR